MSLRRMTPVLLAAALCLGASVNDANARERRDQVCDQVAGTIVRLLPPQPKPARRFAPVPVPQDLIEQIPSDLLDPDPVLPPWPVDPFEGREICVGTVLDGELGDGPAVIGMIDCDLVAPR